MCHVMVVSLDSADLKHSFCHLNRVSLAKSVVIFFQGTYLLLHQVFIGNMLTNDTRMYLLSCNGLCKNINVEILLGSGDLHVFSKDDEPLKLKVFINVVCLLLQNYYILLQILHVVSNIKYIAFKDNYCEECKMPSGVQCNETYKEKSKNLTCSIETDSLEKYA